MPKAPEHPINIGTQLWTLLSPRPVRDSLTTRERHALKQPRQCTDIIIKAADTGSGTVIMDCDWYINECLRQLNDTKFYRRLDSDITSDILTRVQFFIKRLHNNGVIDDKTKQFLIQVDPNREDSTFYLKYTNMESPDAPLFLATVIPQNASLTSLTTISNHWSTKQHPSRHYTFPQQN